MYCISPAHCTFGFFHSSTFFLSQKTFKEVKECKRVFEFFFFFFPFLLSSFSFFDFKKGQLMGKIKGMKEPEKGYEVWRDLSFFFGEVCRDDPTHKNSIK